MAIKILYFAALRDALGTVGEMLDLPEGVGTVGDLRVHLAGRGEGWAALGTNRNVRAARNHRMVQPSEQVSDGDEIAFFPPVTGG